LIFIFRIFPAAASAVVRRRPHPVLIELQPASCRPRLFVYIGCGLPRCLSMIVHNRTREVPALLPLFALNICRVCASFSIVGVVACPCLACGGAEFV
jgi:hypothetical protein